MPLLLIVVFLCGCNPEKKSQKQIESLQARGNKYEAGIACMRYISRHGNDLGYSRTLVKKLLDMGFYAEGVHAADLLLKKFPADAELFLLQGLGYRGLHQYEMALQSMRHALELAPRNNRFIDEVAATRELQTHWKEVQSLNQSLTPGADSFNILLNRAEKFFRLQQYDAVVYDLGAISKMGSREDSLYFNERITAMYKDRDTQPLKTLGELLEYFRRRRN